MIDNCEPDAEVFLPWLILREFTDGRVNGVWMGEGVDGVHARFADAYAEPEEVATVIEQLRTLAPSDQFMAWSKGGNVTADSLRSAIVATPESDSGKKHVLVYRECEWLYFLWSNPARPGAIRLILSISSDFHMARMSKAKRRRWVHQVDRARRSMELRQVPEASHG